MPTWIIEPRDPLIVRDGRPFGPDPGARAATLPFPFPSTTTGGARSLAGRVNGIFDPHGMIDGKPTIDYVKGIAVRGPLLVQLKHSSVVEDWFAPAPADALVLEQPDDTSAVNIKRLVPRTMPDNAKTDLPNDLMLLEQEGQHDPAKPLPDAPRFWCWQQFEQWLRDGTPGTNELSRLGLGALPTDERMHVSIVSETQTAREGFLFQTRGLEFSTTMHERQLEAVKRLALALLVDDDLGEFDGGLAPLGGERRLVRWASTDWTPSLDQDETIRNQIAENGYCRLVLLTPACFRQGFRPEELLRMQHGVTPKLRAVALPRPQVVSGWDFQRGRPKPTRRLVPAGAVYFLELDGTKEERQEWINNHWMHCISDDPQDCADGFGLAVLGTWSGQLAQMEVG